MDILKYVKKAGDAINAGKGAIKQVSEIGVAANEPKIESKKPAIYFDYASITPIDQNVEKTLQSFSSRFHNPSSLYAGAVENKNAIGEARREIASIFNVQSDEVIFTASGTEANNLAILGVFNAYMGKQIPHMIVSAIEHPSIIETCKEVERLGGEVTYIVPEENGVVDVKKIKKALRPTTLLVSVMYANNEIGTIQPVGAIGRVVREYREEQDGDYPFFHTDASQAPNYLPIHIGHLGADLVTLDAGKVYGPRSIGLLAVRRTVPIHPIVFGGGQEQGLRAGTENVAAIVGFAQALSITEKMREAEGKRLVEIRDYLETEIKKKFPDVIIHGEDSPRLPNIVNICSPGLDAEFAVIKLDHAGILCSSASACQSNAEENYSQTVAALPKIGESCKRSSLRFSMGRGTTKEHINKLISALEKILPKN